MRPWIVLFVCLVTIQSASGRVQPRPVSTPQSTPQSTVQPAQANQAETQFTAGLGFLTQNMGRTTRSDEASVSTFGPTLLTITAGGQFYFGEWGFAPLLAIAPLGRTTEDNAAKVTAFSLSLPVYKIFDQKYEAKLGPGWLLQIMSGKGGTTDLNNGTSTQTFYRPSTTVVSGLIYIDAGFGMVIVDKLRLDADLWITGLLSGRRAVSFFAALSWGFL